MAICVHAEGTGPPRDRLSVVLRPGTPADAAEAIAVEVGGSIIHAAPSRAFYLLKLQLRTRVEYKELVSKLRSDPRLLRVSTGPFSDPPARVADTGGESYAAGEVLATLRRDVSLDDAESIAANISAIIAGYTPSINTYRYRLTGKRQDLDTVLKLLRRDARVVRVSRNLVMPLENGARE